MSKPPIDFIFFGGEPLAVPVLEELKGADLLPKCIVCNPDRPQGRKMLLTPPPAKVWALEHGIHVFQPETLRNQNCIDTLKAENADLFIVVAYGKIIPKAVLDLPAHGTLNLHPSLLPKFRGPSPIRSAILENVRETGVTIMLMDEEMDHGPIIAQKAVSISESAWPMRGQELDALLAREGGALLRETVPKWFAGDIEARAQEHEKATYTKKITKDMGEIDLSDDPYQNLLKIRAFDGWPGAFFFKEVNGKKIRVKITDAELASDGSLKINRVIPEGRKEMGYTDFLKQ